MAEEYEVGYGKPPKETQFAKGQSGNPKGRPTGSRNIGTMFNEITRELISVTENGRTRSMTRTEAVLHRMTNLALSGDPRTMREIVHLSRIFEEVEQKDDASIVPHERETAVFQSVLKRMSRMSLGSKSEGGTAASHGEETE